MTDTIYTSKPNTILFYGHQGWIGKQMSALLKQSNIPVIYGESRLENIAAVESEILAHKPTHVISFTGRTHGKVGNRDFKTIDYLEQPGKLRENVRDNLFGPIVLANFSNKYNFHLTYLGTGCIFEYDNEHLFEQEANGFTEESVPNFWGSGYSTVKGFTDQLMHMYPNVLNLRIRMPITSCTSSRNFIMKIVTYDRVCSIANSMTVLEELLPVAYDMAMNNITGTMNLTNPGLITHNEILEMYREIVNPHFTWKNFTMEEQSGILAAGRSNNYLDTTRLTTLYPHVTNIKDSVREVLIRMKRKMNERMWLKINNHT